MDPETGVGWVMLVWLFLCLSNFAICMIRLQLKIASPFFPLPMLCLYYRTLSRFFFLIIGVIHIFSIQKKKM